MNKIKTKIIAMGAAVAPMLCTFAAEGDTDIAQATSDALLELLTKAAPLVSGIIVAGLAIWGGIALVGLLKRSFSAGKGR